MNAPRTLQPHAAEQRETTPAGLVVRNLSVDYERGGYTVRALDAVDLDVAAGEFTVLLGPSGSGKTTLLSCIGGLLTPTTGTVELNGVEVTALGRRDRDRYRRHDVGFVFQAFNLVAALTALENVAAPAMLTGTPRRAAFAAAAELLDRVGLTHRARHRPAHLSGGEQQRVAIARGLIGQPTLVIADEPTANLDHHQAERVVEVLRSLTDDGRMVVVSTHDRRLCSVADQVVDLADGAVVDAATTDSRPEQTQYSMPRLAVMPAS